MDANNNFVNQNFDSNGNYQGFDPNTGYQNNGYGPVSAPASEIGVLEWFLTMLVSAIPTVGLIYLIVCAVSNNPNKIDKKNWAIATLIWQIISLILILLLYFILFSAGVALTR